jgi:hypothetical protein
MIANNNASGRSESNKLDLLKKNSANFKQEMKLTKLCVNEHCSLVRNQIDLQGKFESKFAYFI